MTPTIRIDDEVYDWLRGQAVPFDDTPNSVLRRIARLDPPAAERNKDEETGVRSAPPPHGRTPGRRPPLATGEELRSRWKIPVLQARFHRDGHYYEHLTKFPAALCDRKGYIVFQTEEEYRNCPLLHLGQQVNVEQPGIASIPGYCEVDDPLL
jgi:hypothetical protein